MTITVTVKGPLASATGVRSVIEAEFRQANRDAGALMRTEANRIVRRDRGIYAESWQPGQDRTPGGRTIATRREQNTAPHAAVMEDGVGAGKGPAPWRVFYDWSIRRGIQPQGGEGAREQMAKAMVWKRYRLGWPHSGSLGYPVGPPKPVEVALFREAGPIAATYDRAGARIARRLS
jgi:hypothetical protein